MLQKRDEREGVGFRSRYDGLRYLMTSFSFITVCICYRTLICCLKSQTKVKVEKDHLTQNNRTLTGACDFSCEGNKGIKYISSFIHSVMGHVISTGLELVATTSSPRLDERLCSAVRRTVELAGSQDISPRERLHVKAVELFSHG